MKRDSVNTFSGGVTYDVNPITTPNNILTDAVNGTFITFNGDEMALQNDAGNTTIVSSFGKDWGEYKEEEVYYKGAIVRYNDGIYLCTNEGTTGTFVLEDWVIVSTVVSLSPNFKPIGLKEHGGILYIVSKKEEKGKDTVFEIGSYPSPSNTKAAIETFECGNIEIVGGTVSEKQDNKLGEYILLSNKELVPGDPFKLQFTFSKGSAELLSDTTKRMWYTYKFYLKPNKGEGDFIEIKDFKFNIGEKSEIFYDEDLQFLPNYRTGLIYVKFELEDIDEFTQYTIEDEVEYPFPKLDYTEEGEPFLHFRNFRVNHPSEVKLEDIEIEYTIIDNQTGISEDTAYIESEDVTIVSEEIVIEEAFKISLDDTNKTIDYKIKPKNNHLGVIFKNHIIQRIIDLSQDWLLWGYNIEYTTLAMGNFYFNSPDKSDLKLFNDNSDGNLFFDYLYGFTGSDRNPVLDFPVSNDFTLVPFNPGFREFTFATSVPGTNSIDTQASIKIDRGNFFTDKAEKINEYNQIHIESYYKYATSNNGYFYNILGNTVPTNYPVYAYVKESEDTKLVAIYKKRTIDDYDWILVAGDTCDTNIVCKGFYAYDSTEHSQIQVDTRLYLNGNDIDIIYDNKLPTLHAFNHNSPYNSIGTGRTLTHGIPIVLYEKYNLLNKFVTYSNKGSEITLMKKGVAYNSGEINPSTKTYKVLAYSNTSNNLLKLPAGLNVRYSNIADNADKAFIKRYPLLSNGEDIIISSTVESNKMYTYAFYLLKKETGVGSINLRINEKDYPIIYNNDETVSVNGAMYKHTGAYNTSEDSSFYISEHPIIHNGWMYSYVRITFKSNSTVSSISFKGRDSEFEFSRLVLKEGLIQPQAVKVYKDQSVLLTSNPGPGYLQHWGDFMLTGNFTQDTINQVIINRLYIPDTNYEINGIL